jgi:hypothetical protein
LIDCRVLSLSFTSACIESAAVTRNTYHIERSRRRGSVRARIWPGRIRRLILVSREAPRLTTTGPAPYDDPDAHRPLEAGMVVSIETTMRHPRRGFIKLEDTVAVTAAGYEIFGEGGFGWNIGSSALVVAMT